MKKATLILILIATLILSACKATISESAMETAVSQVILTSAASDSPSDSGETTTEQEQQPAGPSNQELEAAQAALDQANIQLTEQAGQISALQAELDALYPLLTPTITATPFDTPTPMPTNTPTPRPTATVFTLPYYQKYVTPVDKAPLYYFDDKNDAGFPIMLKTSPVQKVPYGEEIIVDVNKVRADGGGVYYLIVGPKYTNYYVFYTDVQDVNK